jgi:hypothetical protein
MAATVVKDYLLPMFDTDGKKLLKRKGKIPGLSITPSNLKSDMNGDCVDKPTTVYEELKLTQILQNEIDSLRADLADRT